MDLLSWRKIISPYEMAVQELVLKFRHLKREYIENDIYCPIEQVSGRVKSIASILEKMQRKNISTDEMEQQVEDIAGIRIICQFVEDIQKISALISDRSDMEVIQVKDYVSNRKESGYRSYHLIILYEVQTLEGPKKVQAEIQIRTMAMDYWATVEHSLQYKYKGEIPAPVRERLSSAADSILSLDDEMSSVRNDIMDAQLSSQHRYMLVEDILNCIEKMFHKANIREIQKIQDEFFRVYASNDLEKLQYFHEQLDNIAESYQAQHVETDSGEV